MCDVPHVVLQSIFDTINLEEKSNKFLTRTLKKGKEESERNKANYSTIWF